MTVPKETIFMLGIGGSGMRGLAYLLHAQGKHIIGADDVPLIDATDKTLAFAQIVSVEDAGTFLKQCDRLIYSDAVPASHVVREKAEKFGVSQDAYQTALGTFATDFKTLAITGTHGKSTTTAMLAHVLSEANVNPTVLIGASVPAFNGLNAHAGTGEFFVVEADEYREHFLTLKPTHAIITTIDYDHPDYFPSIEAVENSYSKFISQVKTGGAVIVLKSVFEQHPGLAWPTDNRLIIVDDGKADEIALTVSGRHMRQNAALVLALCDKLGLPTNDVKKSLTSFTGIGRRMELLGNIGDMDIFSDYGHHPAEISATLSGMREAKPEQSILALFEAHMIERLKTFQTEFGQALANSDGVLLCPVFMPKGRTHEQPTALLALQQQLEQTGKPVRVIESYEKLPTALADFADQFDVAIAFTAGDLDAKLRQILKK